MTAKKADTETTPANPLEKLRVPFPPNQVSKLPKETRAQIDKRKADKSLMVWRCAICGGAHHKDAVHLDYVGHAAATDRLLDTDLEWDWEPMGTDERGLPAFDQNGGLWIKLTVCGKTRLGYGSADGKTGGDAKKEIIGDAIRNAGMRFGMALDLWHKGDLHADEDEAETPQPEPSVAMATEDQVGVIDALTKAAGVTVQTIIDSINAKRPDDAKIKKMTEMTEAGAASVIKKLNKTIEEKSKTKPDDDMLDSDVPY